MHSCRQAITPIHEKVAGSWIGLPKVQRLFLECARVTTCNRRLVSNDIDPIKEILTNIDLPDLGMELPAENPARRPMEYQEIYSGPDYTLSMFLIPKGLRMPLHDHPGMLVLTKLLYGALAVDSFDAPWATPNAGCEVLGDLIESNEHELQLLGSLRTPPTFGRVPMIGSNRNIYHKRQQIHEQCQEAVQVRERFHGIFQASRETNGYNGFRDNNAETVVDAGRHLVTTLPESCNLHEFVALSDSALLDVIMPSYDEDGGRECLFYTLQPRQNAMMNPSLYRATIASLGNYFTRWTEYKGPKVDPPWLLQQYTS
eukprot:Platyproteum_vivax@DN5174_c0_g1_i1.p1